MLVCNLLTDLLVSLSIARTSSALQVATITSSEHFKSLFTNLNPLCYSGSTCGSKSLIMPSKKVLINPASHGTTNKYLEVVESEPGHLRSIPGCCLPPSVNRSCLFFLPLLELHDQFHFPDVTLGIGAGRKLKNMVHSSQGWTFDIG